MNIVITRQKSGDTGTPGDLIIVDSSFICKTLELPWDNNLPDKSCIEPDTYSAWVWMSPHFQRNVIRLEDKHGRADCLIHPGNFAGNIALGFECQVEGCTLVGELLETMSRTDGNGMQFGIANSGSALDALLAALDDGPHTVTYQWAEGCTP